MKAIYNTVDKSITVELEFGNQQELFEHIATFSEIFSKPVCRAKIGDKVLESDDIRFIVRTDKDENKYYEQQVMSGPLRYFKRHFGCRKLPKGELFPKKFEGKDYEFGFDGWARYIVKKDGKQESKDSGAPF